MTGMAALNSKIVAPEPQASIRTIKEGDLTWIDIVPPTKEAMKFLSETFHFHTLALEDCLSQRQISKMDDFQDYIFFVFHFNRYDKKTRISTKRQWSAFIGDNFIVTLHTGEFKAPFALFTECEANSESRQKYLTKGSGYLLYKIIDVAIDSYFPVLDKIMRLLEETEDSVFDQDVEATQELSFLRRDIITQRMVMFPSRILITEIRNKINRYCKIDITSEYDDLIDHLNKICQTLDECQEVIEVFKDADYTLVTQRLNRVVRTMNVFATIVLPLLGISSLYGMNVPLPGGLERGDYTTFLVLVGLIAALTGGMLLFFHRRKWI
jgi:magnesium transporter